MTSVPPIRLHDDDGEWLDLEAALSVAHDALTDAVALVDRMGVAGLPCPDRGLKLGPALGIILTILDAYLDPHEHTEAES